MVGVLALDDSASTQTTWEALLLQGIPSCVEEEESNKNLSN